MLLSQIVVNLLLKLGQRVNRVADPNGIGYNVTHGKHNMLDNRRECLVQIK
jgi:hypothetical protein